MGQRDDPDGDRFFAVTTFRRDGTPVSVPIWLAGAEDRWYAYTPGKSWKVRRLRRDDRVKVARSDFHGEPRGEWHTGRGRVLPSAELREVRRVMTAKYGNRFRLFQLVTFIASPRNGRAVGLELTLDTAID